MSCVNQAIAGLARDCATSMGGIKKVYIAAYEDVATVEVTEGKISAITMVDTKKFYEYALRKGAGSFTSTNTIDPANGVNYVTTDLVFNMLRMDTVKRTEMAALSVNELAVIVEDANGIYWYLGYDEAVTATTGGGQTGTARTDGNMFTITLQDTAVSYPYEVDASIIAGLI